VLMDAKMALPVDRMVRKGEGGVPVFIEEYDPPVRARGRMRMACLHLFVDKDPVAMRAFMNHVREVAKSDALKASARSAVVAPGSAGESLPAPRRSTTVTSGVLRGAAGRAAPKIALSPALMASRSAEPFLETRSFSG